MNAIQQTGTSPYLTRVAGNALYIQNGRYHVDSKIKFESFECAFRILLDAKEVHRGTIGWNTGKCLEAGSFQLDLEQPAYGTEFIMKTYDRYGGLMSTYQLILSRPDQDHD